MKTKLLLSTALLLAVGSTTFAESKTGRQLDVIAFSDNATTVPSSGTEELFLERPIVGIFWDERCASVEYTFNSNVGANPDGDVITPATLANIVQTGLDRWNNNPSSYINLEVTSVRDLGNRPRIGGDFINEITFITPADFGALASSPSTSLLSDDTFIAGEDLDGDGDADVFDPETAARNTCFDADGDGDIEFPAGDYLAGTILDNDVQFASGVLWETTPTNTGGADVDAVSTHEFGHSHGLSHSIINQTSDTDGSSSTMFPFIDTNQANSETSTRTLSSDDLSASAYLYPEGQGNFVISQIQEGDIPFDDAYQVIRGNTLNADNSILFGAAVKMVNRLSDREIVSQTYSGQSSAFQNLEGGLFVFSESAVSGAYSVPVPKSTLLTAELEALDGSPIAAGNVSLNAIISDILGLTSFPEESWTVNDSNIELRPTAEVPFSSFRRSDVNFVANEELTQRNAGDIDFGGTGAIFGASDLIYAELFDRDEVSQLIAEGNTPIGGNAETFLIQENASVATFSKAQLAIGVINEDGNVDITEVLSTRNNVVAQDSDNSHFPFWAPESLPFRIRNAFNQNSEAQLFFLLEVNDVPSGPNAGFPLAFIGLDIDIGGTSFLSTNNGPLQPRIGDTFAMELRYVNQGRPVPRYLQEIR